MTDKKLSFNDAFVGTLQERLLVFLNRKSDKALHLEVYMVIFNVLGDMFNQANMKLSDEGVNFLAQLYYDSISLNGDEREGMDPNIFTQRARLDNIRTEELILYANLFKDVPAYLGLFMAEIKRRS